MKYTFIVILGVLLCNACSKTEQLTEGDDLRQLRIRLTDAPTNLEEVNVEILKVVVKGDNLDEEIDLNTSAGVYNLLDLQNGVEVLLAEGEVELSSLNQIRLILGADNSVMQNGQVFELKTPSAQQSGLKINLNKILKDTESNEILVDFDAEQSVKELGSGDFMLKPVLKILE